MFLSFIIVWEYLYIKLYVDVRGVFMNEVVLNYLKENKEKYNIDDLKQEILSKGYSESEFNEALNELNGKKILKKDVKYKSLGEASVPKKKKGFLIFLIILTLLLGGIYLLCIIKDINLFRFFN